MSTTLETGPARLSAVPTAEFGEFRAPAGLTVRAAITTLGRIESRQPWMLRLVDAPAAVAARG